MLFRSGAATNLRILSIVSMPVVAIYPSPDGRYVAFAVEGGKAEARELHVTSAADYAEPRLIAARIVSDPDWTADGRSIVYAESDGHEDGGACPVASIISQQLRGEDGRLLDKFGELENLAITLSGTRIRCLDDGRIIFSGIEITLPATPAEMPDEGQLFSLDPKRHSSIVRLIPRRQAKHVDFTTQFYELSPDQKQVAIVAKEHVSVLTLATGEITVIKSGKFPKSCGSVPAWHPDGRLTYLAPAENGAGSRLVLATPGRDEKPSVSETPTPPSTPAPRTLLTFPAPEPDAAVKQEGNQ